MKWRTFCRALCFCSLALCLPSVASSENVYQITETELNAIEAKLKNLEQAIVKSNELLTTAESQISKQDETLKGFEKYLMESAQEAERITKSRDTWRTVAIVEAVVIVGTGIVFYISSR